MIHSHFNSIPDDKLNNYLWSVLPALKKSLD